MLQTASSLEDDDNIHSEALFKLNFKQIPPSFKVAKAKEVNNLKEKLKLPTKPVAEKSTTRYINTFNSTMRANGSTYSYNTFTTKPSTTTPTSAPTRSTTSTHLPKTTTTITSTTTANSSTMNLTPKANTELNTKGIRESIQKNLPKNLIEGEESFKKSLSSERNDNEKDFDLETFPEQKIKSTEYLETSTIIHEMNHHSSPPISYKSSTTTFTLPSPPNPTTDNLTDIPSIDIVDDPINFLELIEDDKSGNRLFNVLNHNNITLEELIEHRIHDTSQLHLAAVVESSPRFYPDEKSALKDNIDIVTVIENLPHFSLFNLQSVKSYNIKTDSELTKYSASIIDIENTDEV